MKKSTIYKIVIVTLLSFHKLCFTQKEDVPCTELWLDNDKMVCVCTQEKCDRTAPPPPLESGYYDHIVSSMEGHRFKRTRDKIGACKSEFLFPLFCTDLLKEVPIYLNLAKKFQTIIGFGGAMTDATCLNANCLPLSLGFELMKDYFGSCGLNYALARVPIGGTDFSNHAYSYDDRPPGETDESLTHFALTKEEDELCKIPWLLFAQFLNPKLKYFASLWSPPPWMKTNNWYTNTNNVTLTKLKNEYRQTLANYYVKFLEAYKESGILFWAVTTQNEPFTCSVPLNPINCLGFFPWELIEWIKYYLKPTLSKSTVGPILVLTGDDQTPLVSLYAIEFFVDKEALKSIDGFALHWYLNNIIDPTLPLLELCTGIQNTCPEKIVLSTEACNGLGTLGNELGVDLGSWSRGERYAADIIKNLRQCVAGWVDWNMALDMTGGPSWINNFVDSPIIVNCAEQVYYKQPMYYAIGQFSKYISPGSVRIDTQCDDFWSPLVVAFERPDGCIVVVILNSGSESKYIAIIDWLSRAVIRLLILPRSVNTVIYKN